MPLRLASLRDMARRYRAAVYVLAALLMASQAALLGFVIVHDLTTSTAAVHSDFASSWLGGAAWRTAGPSHAYDVAVQRALYQSAAPGVPLVYPNTWAPASLLLMIPFSLMPLGIAFVVWLLLQLGLLAGAVAFAVRAAAPRLPARFVLIASATAALCAGSVATVLFGQWDGVAAIGVAIAYTLWRRGHDAAGAAVLTVLLLSGKPHLALGFIAFMLAAGRPRPRAGCIAGLAVTVCVDVLLVHLDGLTGWLHTLTDIAALPPEGSLSVFGLSAISVGAGTLATVLAVAAAGLLLIASAWFGRAWRRGAVLEVCLLGAGCASLLISPHLFTQDLALLAPLVGALVVRAVHDGDRAWAAAITVGWGMLSLAAEYQILPLGFQRPDALVALLLIGALLLIVRRLGRERDAQRATLRTRRTAVPALR